MQDEDDDDETQPPLAPVHQEDDDDATQEPGSQSVLKSYKSGRLFPILLREHYNTGTQTTLSGEFYTHYMNVTSEDLVTEISKTSKTTQTILRGEAWKITLF